MKLYELSQTYQQAISGLQELLESGDVDPASVADTLEGIEGEVKDKAINVALHIKNLRSDIEQLEGAQASFGARAKSAKRALEFYERYLDLHLTKCGISEIKSDFALIKYRALPAIVEVTGAVPEEFQRIIPESREPDKKAIMEALKRGKEVANASLVTGRTKLEIK